MTCDLCPPSEASAKDGEADAEKSDEPIEGEVVDEKAEVPDDKSDKKD